MEMILPLYGCGDKEINLNTRKKSLLIGFQENKQKYIDSILKRENEKIILLELYPEMKPTYIITLTWDTGGDSPVTYNGIAAVNCKSLQPWKLHPVDYIEQKPNIFKKLSSYKAVEVYSFSPCEKKVFLEESNFMGIFPNDLIIPRTIDTILDFDVELSRKDKKNLENLFETQQKIVKKRLEFNMTHNYVCDIWFENYKTSEFKGPFFQGTDNPQNKDFKQQLKKNKRFVNKFCKEMNVKLLDVGITNETGSLEPAYLFSDGLGYYTIKGVKGSLKSSS